MSLYSSHRAFVLSLVVLLFLCSTSLFAQNPSPASSSDAAWTTSNAIHAIGLPGAKPKEKGSLVITADTLTFTTKLNRSTLPLASVLEASAGNERVELWGIKGRLLRMAIPDGGGLAAAAVMHHRVDMFSIAFLDSHAGYHEAVFYLPAKEAEHALQVISATTTTHTAPSSNACDTGQIRNPSVRIALPDWNHLEVPSAYRALVYEQLVDSFEKTKGLGRIYRDGETDSECPQYTVQLTVNAFKHGNQVTRASMGPAGFFVGTTQMTFDLKVSDSHGSTILQEQIKATIRGESESTQIAEKIAKKAAKTYSHKQAASPQSAVNRNLREERS